MYLKLGLIAKTIIFLCFISVPAYSEGVRSELFFVDLILLILKWTESVVSHSILPQKFINSIFNLETSELVLAQTQFSDCFDITNN